MTFQIQQATFSDLEELAGVMVSAHVNDKLVTRMMWDVPHEEQVKWYADGFKKGWDLEEEVRYHKVVDQATGRIVAMARFHYPWTMSAAVGYVNHYGPYPEGSNIDLCDAFFQKLEKYEGKYIDRQATYWIYFLATLPAYHRKGLGKELMDICLKDADADHARTFLISTEAGSGLYKRLGFEEIDSLSWNLRPYGRDEKITWLCMMREPKLPIMSDERVTKPKRSER